MPGRFDQAGDSGGGEKWVHSWFVLKVEPTDFAAGCV